MRCSPCRGVPVGVTGSASEVHTSTCTDVSDFTHRDIHIHRWQKIHPSRTQFRRGKIWSGEPSGAGDGWGRVKAGKGRAVAARDTNRL